MSLGLDLIDYAGYLVLAVPTKVEGGRWAPHVKLCKAGGTALEKHEWKSFTGEETFADQDEAIAHSVTLGNQIIDGQVPGCSIQSS